MIFGYARVSTQEQSLDRQLDILKNEGAEEIVLERCSGQAKCEHYDPKKLNLA